MALIFTASRLLSTARLAAWGFLALGMVMGTPVQATNGGKGNAASPSPAPEVALADLIRERLAIPKPDMTALQIEDAYQQFENSLWGRRVRVEGQVLDASNRPGGYFIHVQLPHMSRPMLFQAHKEAALAARKGQKIVIAGTLRGFLGMNMEPQLDQVSFPELPAAGGTASPTPTPAKK